LLMKANSVYTSNSHEMFSLSIKLGSGGEGTVYAVEGNPDICVKIYHEQKRTPELEAKLKAMIDAPPKDPTLVAGHYSICWPTNVVYEDEACTKFLGFTMPRIDKNTFKEYHLLCDKPGVTTSTCYRLEHFGTGFTYLHMYVVALNLASCVASIHNAGHAIGDLNDKNILVSTKDSKITIVDCDSFEIHAKDNNVFPCSVYMPEYSAPEVILHKDIKNRQESDRFALSILIFKLLMLNTHPYASRGSSVEHLNTPGEKIAEGYYPYEDYADLDVNPPAYALPYEIIPPNIKALFRRCFVEGQHDPEKRPSAVEWFRTIKENYVQIVEVLKKKKQQCAVNYLHLFPLHLETCPWCRMKDDYFPERIVVNKKQRVRAVSDGRFDYLDSIIKIYAQDDKITDTEYYSLLKTVLSDKITFHDMVKRIKYHKQTNPALIIGDEPHFSENNLHFEMDSNEYFNYKKKITITNNYSDESLYLDFVSNKPFVRVNPHSMTLKPREKQDVSIAIISRELSKIILDGRLIAVVEASYNQNRIIKKKAINIILDIGVYEKQKIALLFIIIMVIFGILLLLITS